MVQPCVSQDRLSLLLEKAHKGSSLAAELLEFRYSVHVPSQRHGKRHRARGEHSNFCDCVNDHGLESTGIRSAVAAQFFLPWAIASVARQYCSFWRGIWMMAPAQHQR